MKNYVIRCFTWFTHGGMSSFRALLSWWTRCQSRWTLASTKSITCWRPRQFEKTIQCEKTVHTKPNPPSDFNQQGGPLQQPCCQTFGRLGMRIPSLWLAFSFASVFSGNLADILSPFDTLSPLELGRNKSHWNEPFLFTDLRWYLWKMWSFQHVVRFSLQALDFINVWEYQA